MYRLTSKRHCCRTAIHWHCKARNKGQLGTTEKIPLSVSVRTLRAILLAKHLSSWQWSGTLHGRESGSAHDHRVSKSCTRCEVVHNASVWCCLGISHCSYRSRRLTGRTSPLEDDNCSILSKLTIQRFLSPSQSSISCSPSAKGCSRTSEWHQDMLRQLVVRNSSCKASWRVSMYCQSTSGPPLSKAGMSRLRRSSTSC